MRYYTEKFEMTQRVELADKVCPCGAMSTGAYRPSDATRSYRRRHQGDFVGVLNLTMTPGMFHH